MTVKIISGKLRTILLEFPTQKKFKKIEEEIPEDLYNDILNGFAQEKEMGQNA